MTANKTPVYQTKEVREFEKLAAERLCINGDTLMSRAGKAAYELLLKRWPHAKRIAVFCGGGNNGGDGYVLAGLLHDRGAAVMVCQVGDHTKLKAEALHAKERCEQSGVPMQAFHPDIDLQYPDVIVDAICGIGIKEDLRGDATEAVSYMNGLPTPVLAIDIPTGIEADTGRLLGSVVKADATMTFIGMKLGLITGSGSSYAGEVTLNDLQLPAEIFTYVKPVAEKIELDAFDAYLLPRLKDWHKGLSGHVLVIGGSPGFSGAPAMAGMAALRVGAGL